MTTIVGLLENAAARFGTRLALVTRVGYRVRRWSNSDLWTVSKRVAAYLQANGITKGDRVVLWAQSSPEWVAVFFGCLRTGAVVVPLDTRGSAEFVRKVVDQTLPKLAFLSSGPTEGLDGLGVPVVKLGELETLLDGVDPAPEPVPLAPDDIAEVMFTSGTTGDPKGVVLTHGNIVANVEAATQAVPSRPSYRLLSLLPLSHMLEQTVGLLAPLTGGASVCYPQSRQSTVIFRAFREHRITTVVLVPQALQLFMNAMEGRVKEQGRERLWHILHQVAPRLPMALRRVLFAQVHRQLGGSLKFVICGGAYLDPALARKWEALGVPVLQGYGTTEASPIISCNTFKRRKLDSVGRPLPGVEVRIASDGEVLVRGPNITPGYWQDPHATRAAFEDGRYKTGDLGCMDSDGFLYFKGRKKDVIVLPSGLNAYPEDIETVLKKHPDVADAVVVGLPTQGQEVQVHGVLLLKDGRGDAEAIVEQVNSSLAEHQRVQDFTVWPEPDLPRTHTLKVKKHEVLEKLLQIKGGERPAPAGGQSTCMEVSALVRLLSRMVQRPPEQVQPSMRLGGDLGLDSLGRVELLATVETELGVYLDESQVSEAATVGQMETMIAQAGKRSPMPQYWEWPLSGPMRVVRAAIQAFPVFPLLRLVAPGRVVGREHLEGLRGPVIFAVNHLSHMDTPVVLAALPRRWRLSTAVAAAADVWFAKWRLPGSLMALLFNAFPFSRTDSVRPSIEHCSRLLDRGWSVLIYPEGTRSNTGHMGAFKSGTGLMAVELGVPVVPVRVTGTYEVLAKDRTIPRRGSVQVGFGKPLRFSARTSYIEATRAIEDAVRSLGPRRAA